MWVTTKAHWEEIYASRQPTEVSWYEPNPATSLSLIGETRVPKSASIIDVGGGASTLVDNLLDAGFTHLTVLDVAANALRRAQERLGDRARAVTWLEADVLAYDFPEQSFDLWHDRAAFHFLTNPIDQEQYVERARRALRHGGHLIVATFASDGPSRCSGLEVVRYGPEELAARFTGFQLVAHRNMVHRTPAQKDQRFLYCRFVSTAQWLDSTGLTTLFHTSPREASLR
jgi:ubiquinone/menaquinone biosynthesis C-methylase UbiE